MKMFCQYKDALGKVGKGVHSIRLFNIAIVDVLMTLLVAYLIAYYYPQYQFWKVSLVLFSLGIILHRLFCVRTTVDKFIFPE